MQNRKVIMTQIVRTKLENMTAYGNKEAVHRWALQSFRVPEFHSRLLILLLMVCCRPDKPFVIAQ